MAKPEQQARTGLLLVTHAGIATALLAQARLILDDPMEGVETFEANTSGNGMPADLARALAAANQGQGVLVLTDLPGATPNNLARQLCADDCHGVSGLNLPMLIRVWNYRDRPPAELARLAVDGARSAIEALA